MDLEKEVSCQCMQAQASSDSSECEESCSSEGCAEQKCWSPVHQQILIFVREAELGLVQNQEAEVLLSAHEPRFTRCDKPLLPPPKYIG